MLLLAFAPVASAAPPLEDPAPCLVTVLEVLASKDHRGVPDSPARQAGLAAMSPQERRMDEAESHFATYRQCEYAVSVDGHRYRWTATWDTTLEDRPPDWCEQHRGEVVSDIRQTTRACTELHAGAWWGHDLVPIVAPTQPR